MNSTKMLQILIDGQKSIGSDIKSLGKKTEEGFVKVNNRLDVIGKFVAYLEDDTPTRDEHDKLEKRVSKIETKLQFSKI